MHHGAIRIIRKIVPWFTERIRAIRTIKEIAPCVTEQIRIIREIAPCIMEQMRIIRKFAPCVTEQWGQHTQTFGCTNYRSEYLHSALWLKSSTDPFLVHDQKLPRSEIDWRLRNVFVVEALASVQATRQCQLPIYLSTAVISWQKEEHINAKLNNANSELCFVPLSSNDLPVPDISCCCSRAKSIHVRGAVSLQNLASNT